MGVILRYFARLAAIVRPRRVAAPAVSADADGLRVGGMAVAWRDMRRLDAYKRDIYVGDIVCLAILADDGRVFEISEDSPGWHAVGDAIERFLPGSLPHAEWTVRLMAAEPEDSVAIYPV